MSLSRSDLERWSSFASEGLREMTQWVAANANSPFAPTVQGIIDETTDQVVILQTIIKRIVREELRAQKAAIQAQIDALTAEVGP